MKKYKEFLEGDDHEKAYYDLILSISDLDADYDFHKDMIQCVDQLELALKELDIFSGGNEPLDKYSKAHGIFMKNFKIYLRKILKNNDLKFEKFSFDISNDKIGILFLSKNKSDLEKINKFYGITNNDNIKIFKRGIPRAWFEYSRI
jgi:hypothetical protein